MRIHIKSRLQGIVTNERFPAIFLFLIVLLFKLPIMNAPYHWDGMGGTVRGAVYIYQHRFIPFLGMFDFGHPPLLHELLALTWAAVGRSLWGSHLLIIIFSFLGVYFTYCIGRELSDQKTGMLASLLLFFSPLYFAQSGTLNLEIPLTAFIIMTTYFSIKNKTLLAVISGICLVLTKGTGLLLIFSLLIYVFFRDVRGRKKVLIGRLLLYSIPLIVFLGWLVYHRWQAGWLLYNREFSFRIGYTALELYRRMEDLFFGNYHFLVTACMCFYFFLKKYGGKGKSAALPFLVFVSLGLLAKQLLLRERAFVSVLLVCYAIVMVQLVKEDKKLLPLFLFITISLLSFSSYVGFLPRYLVIIYPFYFIIGAYCLVKMMARKSRVLVGVAIILIALFITRWYGQRAIASSGSGAVLESNLEYLDMLKTHRQACRFIENNYPRSVVFTTWPQVLELTDPSNGYVKSSIKCVDFSQMGKDINLEVDLIYYASQADKAFEMRRFIRRFDKKLLQAYECNGKSVEVYAIIKKRVSQQAE